MSCTVYTTTRGFVVLESETDNILFHGFNDWGDILFRTEPIPGKEYPRFKKLTYADFIDLGGGTPRFFDEILRLKSKNIKIIGFSSPVHRISITYPKGSRSGYRSFEKPKIKELSFLIQSTVGV